MKLNLIKVHRHSTSIAGQQQRRIGKRLRRKKKNKAPKGFILTCPAERLANADDALKKEMAG